MKNRTQFHAEGMTGRPCAVAPLERHTFEPANPPADPELCRFCARPRALHAETGFIPAPDRLCCPQDAKASFKGHPYFVRP